MKDYGSGFLALILAGILVMVVGLGMMIPAVRAPENVSLAEWRTTGPSPVFAVRLTTASSDRP